MEKETVGAVISVAKQWWFKINTKPVRTHALDGATFPHVIRASYRVADQEYTARKWLWPSQPLPRTGDKVTVRYREDRPDKGRIVI